MAKPTYRYNHERKEWDHIIRNFMCNGLTLVTRPSEAHYPSKEMAEAYKKQLGESQ